MMRFNWVRWIKGGSTTKKSGRKAPHRFALEELENRVTPATFIWTGLGSDNNWGTGDNWVGNVAPSGLAADLDDLVFPSGTSSTSTNNDISPGLGLTATFNSITITGSNYVLAGIGINLGDASVSGTNFGYVNVAAGALNNRITLPIELVAPAGDQQFFTVNNGGALTISGALSGTSGAELAKEGSGTLTLSADNSNFTGGIKVNAGILAITDGDALGDTSSGTVVATNAQLQVIGSLGTIEEELILNGPGIDNNGAILNVSGDTTWDASVQMDSNTTFGSAAGTLSFRGVISDLGAGHSIDKRGAGTIAFDAANTYRGLTTIWAGFLRISDPFSLGEQGTAANGTIVRNNLQGFGTLQMSDNFGFTVLDELLTINGAGADGNGALQSIAGVNQWAAPITLGGGSNSNNQGFIGVDVDSELTISGQISGSSLTKLMDGTLILNRDNVYVGGTFVSAGILNIRDSRAIGTGAGATVANGATLAYEVDTGFDPHGRDLGIDSVTNVANRLTISRPVSITGTGADGLGALHSISGINVQSGDVTLSGTEAAIGVDADTAPNADETYFTDDYSLTVTGNVVGLSTGTTFGKRGLGHLILPRANTYLGPTLISQGWVTIQNNSSLGGRVVSTGDTAQPYTKVLEGAALHLRPLTTADSLQIAENLNLAGNGVTHPNALFSGKGAIVNLGNSNTLNGEIIVSGLTGWGVEVMAPFVNSELTNTNTIAETTPTINVNGNAQGGRDEEPQIIETGSTSGTLTVNYNMRSVADTLTIYYPPRGQPGSTAIFPTTSLQFTGTVTVAYGPGTSTQIEIVMNEGGSTANITRWSYTASVVPNAVFGGGINKWGSRRLNLMGDGTYTGLVDVKEGVLRVQHDTALGLPGSGTVVQSGAALELAPSVAQFNGGIVAGLNIWGEQLTLNGTGNVLSGSKALQVTTGDHMWRGGMTFGSDTTIDVPDSQRLTVFGSIDDGAALATPPAPAGFAKSGPGELALAGSSSYRGVTDIGAGIVTLMNGGALGATGSTSGTVVGATATIQLVGGITVGGEALTIQGNGIGAAPSQLPLRWFDLGASPLSNGSNTGAENNAGRVTGVVFDPTDAKVMYIATAGGGVWKTEDTGKTWLPLFDSPTAPPMNGGSIAISLSDPRVLYYGTGEGNSSYDSYVGSGVWKSTDSGKTWSLIGSGNPVSGMAVNKIVVDPLISDRIYVATGNLTNPQNFQTTNTPGVFRFDGNWFRLTDKVSFERNSGTSSLPDDAPDTPGPDDDFRIKFPTNEQTYSWTDIVLTAGGELIAALNVPNYGAAPEGAPFLPLPATLPRAGLTTNGVYRLSNPNAGNPTWFVGAGGLANSQPANPFPNPINTAGRAANGSIKLAYGAAAPDGISRLYAIVTRASGTRGFVFETFLSTTNGQNWGATAAQPTEYQNGFGDYSSAVGVDPVDNRIIYVAANNTVLKSTTGGGAWTDVTVGTQLNSPHRYAHVMAFPTGGGNMYLGTDGGIWQLSGSAWAAVNGNLGNLLVNNVATDANNYNSILAGYQMNGAGQFSGSQTWKRVDGANNSVVAIDPKDSRIMYTVDDTGALRKTTDGGTNWTTINTLGVAIQTDGNMRTLPDHGPYPTFALDQVNPSRLVVGSNTGNLALPGVFESNDGGATWITLDGLGEARSIALAQYQGQFAADPRFASVTDKGSNTYDPDTIYLSTGSTIRVSKNRGLTWVDASLPGGLGSVSDITVDPRNRDVIYATRSIFGGTKVYRSTDAGQSWSTFATGLPDVPVWSIAIDPRSGTLYVGTDVGVYMRPTSGNWVKMGIGLPTVAVRDVEVNQVLNTVTVATYGRGVYQFYLQDVQANSGALRAVSGDNVWTGPITLAANSTIYAGGTQDLQGGVSTASLTINGVISDATPGAGFTLTKDGKGDVAFAGSNTYSGLTDIVNGVLIAKNTAALGGNAVTSPTGLGTVVRTGAALELNTSVFNEELTLNGTGAGAFNGHQTGALRNTLNNNQYTGPIVLNTTGNVIGVDTGTTLTITGTISEAGGPRTLTKELTGTLVLNAANTFSGLAQVNQGILRVTNAGALGSVIAGTSVLDGAALEIAGGITVAEPLTLSGTGIFGAGALRNAGGNNTWSGTVTLASLPNFSPTTVPPSAVSIGVSSRDDTLTVSGVVGQTGGTFGLNKVGTGRLTLTNANTYGGATSVNAGALRVGNNAALGTAGTVASGTTVRSGAMLELIGGVTVANEHLFLNGTGVSAANSSATSPLLASAGAVYNVADTNTWTGPVTLQTSSSLGAAAASNAVFTGVVAGAASAALTKVGEGKVTFTGTNTYSGLTTVANGALNIQNAAGLGAGGTAATGTVVNSGGSLQLEGGITVSTETLTLNGMGYANAGALENFAGVNTFSGPIALASDSSVGSTAGELFIPTGITQTGGPRALTKVGPGAVEFNGTAANLYTGTTSVNEGTLRLNKPAATNAVAGDLVIGDGTGAANSAVARWLASDQVVDTADVTVAADGLLDLNGRTEAVDLLTVLGGNVTTGASGTSTFTLNGGLAMTGGTVTIPTANSRVRFGGASGLTTSAAATTATISGAGLIDLNGADRTFTVADGTAAVDLDVSANITGAGLTVTKAGAGLMRFGGSSGLVNAAVNAGELQVNGTLGNVVLAGGMLGGVGTVGTVTGAAGGDAVGTVDPGNEPTSTTGVLTSNDINWGAGTTFFLDLMGTTPGTGHDQLVVNGDIDIAGANLSGIVANTVVIGDSFTIMTFTGTRTGKFATGDGVFIDGKKFTITYNANSIVLERQRAEATISLDATIGTTTVTQSRYGELVVFTVTVTPEPGAAPIQAGSTVTFSLDGGAFVQTLTLDASGKAVFDPMTAQSLALAIGSHTVGVTFNGDGELNSVSLTPARSHNVVRTATTMTLTPSNPTIASGQVTTLRATINPAFTLPVYADVPSGNVVFTVDAGTANEAVYTIPLIGSGYAELPLNTLSVGVHTVSAVYAGDTNFTGTQTLSSNQVTVTKGNSNVAVSSSVNPSNFGQSVTFTATVTAVSPATGLPTGVVTFYAGAAIPANFIANATLNGSGQASISLSSLPIGATTITVVYAGNSNFNASTGTLTQNVNPTATTTTVSRAVGSANPSVFGQSVTFTANVTPVGGSGTPAGNVQFYVDGVAFGTPRALNGVGVASVVIAGMNVGFRNITAEYLGSASFAASPVSGAVSQQVNAANTTTAVNATPNPAGVGQTVVFTAVVSPVAPGGGTPTGTVTFTVDGVPQAPVSITAGAAVFSTNSLSLGNHTVTATYNGSTNHLASPASATLTQRIVSQVTTVTVGASPSPSVFGQGVVFTAQLTGTTQVPTGSVVFTIDGVARPAVAVDSLGRASLPAISNLDVGSHSVVVTYAGNATFSSGTGSLTQVVNKAATTVSIAKSVTQSVYGQSTTFTATVARASAGSAIPTGQVEFFVNGVSQGRRNLDAAGKATLTTVSLPVSTSNLITATYYETANFTGSSRNIAHFVGKASSRAVVTTNRNPGFAGQSVVLTARVSAVAPGGGYTQGTVIFRIDNVNRPAVTLVNGVATLTVSNLSAGNHTVQVLYSGSANHNASNSTILTQQIVVPPPATSLQASVSSPAVSLNTAFTVTVRALTATGATAVGVNAPVTLTLLSGPAGGVLSGTKTRTAVNGVATFSGLSVNVTGRYRVRATVGNLSVIFDIVTVGRFG